MSTTQDRPSGPRGLATTVISGCGRVRQPRGPLLRSCDTLAGVTSEITLAGEALASITRWIEGYAKRSLKK